jgi:hypothetical protein
LWKAPGSIPGVSTISYLWGNGVDVFLVFSVMVGGSQMDILRQSRVWG